MYVNFPLKNILFSYAVTDMILCCVHLTLVSSVQPSLCPGTAQLSTHSQSFPQAPLKRARDMEIFYQIFSSFWTRNGHFNLTTLATATIAVSFQVVLLRMVGVVFPASDFKHPITTPAMLLMGQILLKVHWIICSFSLHLPFPLSRAQWRLTMIWWWVCSFVRLWLM